MKITLADIWFSFNGLQKLNTCSSPPVEKRWTLGMEIFPECEKQYQGLLRMNAEIGEKYSVLKDGQKFLDPDKQARADAEWATLLEQAVELPDLKILLTELGEHGANLTGSELKSLAWILCKPEAGAKPGDCGCGGKAEVKAAGA